MGQIIWKSAFVKDGVIKENVVVTRARKGFVVEKIVWRKVIHKPFYHTLYSLHAKKHIRKVYHLRRFFSGKIEYLAKGSIDEYLKECSA